MLDLTTPSLLFSAISLILLAYTNRFLSYASVVRALKEKHQQTHDPKDIAQIANLLHAVLSDPFHANIRNTQFAALRDRYVLHLCIVADFRRMDIWHSLIAISGVVMCMYLGNKYFR